MQCGAIADIKHPLIKLILKIDKYGIDSEPRNHFISLPSTYIGGWEADGTPYPIPLYYLPERNIDREQLIGLYDLSSFSSSRMRVELTFSFSRLQLLCKLYIYSYLISITLIIGKAFLPVVSKAMIIPYQKGRYVQFLLQYLLHKSACGELRQLRCKRERNAVVDTCSFKQLQLFGITAKKSRLIIFLKYFARMYGKSDDCGGQLLSCGLRLHLIDKKAVPDMHPVKKTNRSHKGLLYCAVGTRTREINFFQNNPIVCKKS